MSYMHIDTSHYKREAPLLKKKKKCSPLTDDIRVPNETHREQREKKQQQQEQEEEEEGGEAK